MTIKIYRDDVANGIFIDGNTGIQFINTLHAIVDNSMVTIRDTIRNYTLIYRVDHSEFVNASDVAYGSDVNTVVNALNAEFNRTGLEKIPEVTSATTVAVVTNATINYELVVANGVATEWTSLPDSPASKYLLPDDGNPRRLIGRLPEGTWTADFRCINYAGALDGTITFNSSIPAFASSSSVNMFNDDRLVGDATTLDDTLSRVGNGSGEDDAWSLSFWFKPGTSTDTFQTMFLYGDEDVDNGKIRIDYLGNTATTRNLQFFYGNDKSRIRFRTPVDSVQPNVWHHILICYDGRDTGFTGGQYAGFQLDSSIIHRDSLTGIFAENDWVLDSAEIVPTSNILSISSGGEASHSFHMESDITYEVEVKAQVDGSLTGWNCDVYDTLITNAGTGVTYIANNDPDASFICVTLDWGSHGSSTNINNFIGSSNAATWTSTTGLNLSAVATQKLYDFHGRIYLEAGNVSFSVQSDDGFRFYLGGNLIGSFNSTRSYITTTFSTNITTAGYYDVNLVYFNATGGGGLRVTSNTLTSGQPLTENNVMERDLESGSIDLNVRVLNHAGTEIETDTISLNTDGTETTHTMQFKGDFFGAATLALVEPNNNLNIDTRIEVNDLTFTAPSSANGDYISQVEIYGSRFITYIDGTFVNVTLNHDLAGYSGNINQVDFFLGDGIVNGFIDDFAIFASDVRDEVAQIYNEGIPDDLNTLNDVPTKWWRMGDNPLDNFPSIYSQDHLSILTMTNMTVANIVNDVPS